MSAVDAAPAAGLRPVEEDLRRLLPDWLARQRWYAGKNGGPPEVERLVLAELRPGPRALLHALVRTGPQDWYQLLIGADEEPPAASRALPPIGSGARHYYEAAAAPELMEHLLELLAGGRERAGLRFHCPDRNAIPLGLPEHAGSAEQSNTSLLFGDRLMLKVLRRPVPGLSPELELLTALGAERTVRSAAPLGWFETAGGPLGSGATLGILQEFLPARGDGWELGVAGAAAWIGAAEGAEERGAEGKGADFTRESRRLGRATAAVHRALASQLPTRTLDGDELAELAAAARRRLRAAVAEVPGLRDLEPRLNACFDALLPLGPVPVQRVHGDLHLGQVLATDADWVLIDFEGEPGRPVAERRLPQPTLRDVAGMLRSFDYAAHQALAGLPGRQRQAEAWRERNRRAYCAGYTEAGGTDPRRNPELLRALEADKAVYEALYERHNRPEWLPVPMAALERLTGRGRTDRGNR